MNWRRVLREVVIGLALVVVTVLLFGEADRRQPAFRAADIRVIEGAIAGFTTVRVWETAAAPQRTSSTVRTRQAFRLADSPSNLLFYIPGSNWDLASDVTVGTKARLEVSEDPAGASARARAYPEATYLQPIAGLQIGDRVYFRAMETVQRAEQAVSAYRRAGGVALLLTVLWLGWLAWSYRHAWRAALAEVREW